MSWAGSGSHSTRCQNGWSTHTESSKNACGSVRRDSRKRGALLAQQVRELNDSREELNQFFFLTPDMLCIAGMDGRFRRVNAAWSDALGWTSEDLTSVPYLDFVHPDDLAPTTAETAKLAAGEATLTFENRYRCKDGSFKWLSWRAAPAASRGLIYAAARDVTEQKRTAHELEERAPPNWSP